VSQQEEGGFNSSQVIHALVPAPESQPYPMSLHVHRHMASKIEKECEWK